MILHKYDDLEELISFLKQDYANNLYFFTYLNDPALNSSAEILIAKHRGKIVIALLLTPVHCCVSALAPEFLHLVANQLPEINSTNVLGRQDLLETFLQLIQGPKRFLEIYSFCELPLHSMPALQKSCSQKANQSNLAALIDFYNKNDMLPGAANRLPGILSWGSVYFQQVNDEIVSCALTTTETEDAAMIGAVYTHPAFRSKGYSKDCITNLCAEMTTRHKTPYLFFNAEKTMLKIYYESLGFKHRCYWILASKT